ncbi:MAG TPA: iron ABC transporter permease [Candidatus Binatia bacterium]
MSSLARVWAARAVARLEMLRARAAERPGVWVAILALALGVALIAALGVGAARLPIADVPRALLDAAHPLHTALWQVRMPRIATAALVGASLAVAGALLQTVVRNPLADPSLIGVSAGAGVAALLGIVLLPEVSLALPFLAFFGALASAAVVLAVAETGPRTKGPLRIILSGVAVQSVLFACIALLTFLFADRAPAFVAFTVGSLAGCGWREVRIVALPAVLGSACALLSVRALDLLLLDDDSASGVGLGVRRTRVLVSCLAALLAAGAVSVAGLVGFVGLVVPNWIRLLVGPEHARSLVLSMLGGATLVVAADAAARTLAAPLELPVGALLALIGGPYFLAILWRRVT